MTIATIATQLNIPTAVIERESIKVFLERKLLLVETELVALANKYKVKGIKDLDRKIKQGLIRETNESRDDFFEFDNLEARRDVLRQLMNSAAK